VVARAGTDAQGDPAPGAARDVAAPEALKVQLR
jgi:hypothetical protein